MNVPEDLKYSKDHEWIRIDGENAYIGITDFAQGELGDIVFVDVNTKGEQLEKEQEFGTIEAVKTVADIFIPLNGEITEVNRKLEDTPETINKDPYKNGWILKVCNFTKDDSVLLSASEYKKLI